MALSESNRALIEVFRSGHTEPGQPIEGFVAEFVADDLSTEIYHRDGVPWWEAPVMRSRWLRRHRHTIQTYGWANWFTCTARCPCGAATENGKRWVQVGRPRS